MILPFLAKILKYSVVNLAACEGAVSFMKSMFLLNAVFFCHGMKYSFRKSMQTLVVILTLSATLNGPIGSVPMIAAQNITPPPPC